MNCGYFDDTDRIIYLCNWIWVEKLLETVADGRRRICATFVVRVVFEPLYHTIFGLLCAKFIEKSSSYQVMVMITISLFIVPVRTLT